MNQKLIKLNISMKFFRIISAIHYLILYNKILLKKINSIITYVNFAIFVQVEPSRKVRNKALSTSLKQILGLNYQIKLKMRRMILLTK